MKNRPSIRKIRIKILALCLIVTSLLCSCKDKTSYRRSLADEYFVFYKDGNKLVIESTTINDTDADILSIADELIEKIMNYSGNNGYSSVFANEVTISSVKISDSCLKIDFSDSYSDLDVTTETFLRAGVVLTLIQIPGVESVLFTVNASPLYVNDVAVLAMTLLSFSDFAVNSAFPAYYFTVDIYNITDSGTTLCEEEHSVIRTTYEKLETIVINELIYGDSNDSNYGPFEEGVRVNSINTNNSVCYIDFSSQGFAVNSKVSDEAAIYSVVNTLTELSYISKVVITIDGSKNMKFGRTALESYYTRNLDIVE